MWVRSEDNQIYNLSYAQQVRIQQRGADYVVCASFSSGGGGLMSDIDTANVNLTGPKTADEAQDILNKIVKSLQAVDLNPEPHTMRAGGVEVGIDAEAPLDATPREVLQGTTSGATGGA